MEKGVTGHIDHIVTLWFSWYALISSLSSRSQPGGQTERGEWEVEITTPWPPGSLGLHPSPRWPLCPPCSSCSSCVCASGGCRPPRCRASSCYYC